ncbi:PAS domain-containing hybrid sensor histidine kinase/response regulator [Albibacterium profundi]|uniref:histidine kinase n=1 Tax=Albibacterium profundi TaxID=3134906 RepID=A0ABV5CHD7_9SPHI
MKDSTNKQPGLLEGYKNERLFQAFFENSQSLLCMHDLTGKFIIVNKTGSLMSGYDPEELTNMSLFDIIPEDRHHLLEEYLKEVVKTGKADGIMKVVTKDRTLRTWMFSNVVKEDDTGKMYIIGSAVDLTERIQLEEDLKNASKASQQASKAKSQFLANMSHEIRTPLNGIIGFTDLLSRTSLDDVQSQYVNIINQSGTTLLEIIDKILDFSKIEAGKISLTNERVDLHDLAAQACDLITYTVDKKQLELLINLSPDLPDVVWGDGVRLKQVLVNLLANAAKFTEEGEIELRITPLKEHTDGTTLIRFEVRDTGIGIKLEKQQEIFEAFSQEDSSITKKYGGTGLGLTISNRLLKLGKSTLQLKSEVGKGSTFYFDIKFKAEKSEVDDLTLQDIKRVLVVDDNESNRRILRHMLELKGITVDEADSGLQALLILQGKIEHDVIIMDYHMPIMDGIETIRKIKGNISHEEQPIIMLYSSSDNDELQSACDELKVESRLVKPIKMREMYQVLARLKKENTEQKLNQSTIEPILCNNVKVLIAEDNGVNLFLAKSIINQISPDAVIYEAKDGLEAVNIFKSEEVDLVLMDVQMPNMNGLDATKEIRKVHKDVHIPILALTAGTTSEEIERCLAAGMDDFVAKPVVKKTIEEMFEKWVGHRLPDDIEPQLTTNEDDGQIEHINESWFDEHAIINPEFKSKFVEILVGELNETKQSLKKKMDEEDLEALNKLGHKLKGTSLTAGLTELCKLAVAFEMLGELDKNYTEDLLEKTNNEITIVVNMLTEGGDS